MRSPAAAIALVAALADCLACGRHPVSIEEPPAFETPWCVRVAYRRGGRAFSLVACFSDESECLITRTNAIDSAGKVAFFTGREIDAVGACWEADVQPEPLP